MRTLRVYADTSVFGGPFDKEFVESSERFFDSIRRGKFVLVISALVRQEILEAPTEVRDLYCEVGADAETVDVTDEALNLRNAYVEADIVPTAARTDALHVAVATIARCDMIVSWNFRHIVNFRRMKQYNAVNALEGYDEISIYSPPEVVANEEDI